MKMWYFFSKRVLVLIFGILGIHSQTDPYANQPRLTIRDGNLLIRSGFNRNVNISVKGEGRIFFNNQNVNNLGFGAEGGIRDVSSLSSMNRKVGQILNAYQSLVELQDKVNQIDENVTEINQWMNQFVGRDQNRITNRRMRVYFSKIKVLEDKVNRLTELLSTNECASNPCRNGGTCVDTYNGYVCNCLSNWEGPTCEMDVNECALYTGTAFGCQNGATCTNLPGSYRCDCTTNWFGIHCTEQHDDCTAASHQELCGHGTCVNEKRVQPGQPKYRCICEPGWTKASNSPACTQDVDECAGSEPKCSVNPRVLCFNLPGTFHCGPCPTGYTGNGLWCEDINECEINNGGCSINPFVECSNTPGSRRCGPCPNGYFGNGEQCMYQSVCNNNRGGCHPLATCIDNPAITATYRECRCPPGYVGNGEGLTGCAPTQGRTCDNNPCQHGTCQMVGNSYHCVCNAGYYGTNCEIEEDPCRIQPCLNGGTCVRQAGSFTCVCATGYSGPTCAEQQRACGGQIWGNNGTLHFPEYSTHYAHLENCEWVISLEDSYKVINLTFDHFRLEGGYGCQYDFLQLNDGPSQTSRMINRFCGTGLQGTTLTSTHNQIYLWFRSDQSESDTGFTLRWTAADPVCGGIFNETEYGSVRSPGYPGLYPNNRDCYWLVQVPFGKRIQFSFATLMLESHQTCDFDYVKIFDGASENDPLIGTYCSTITPPPLITSGHAATILFHSDSTAQDSGFNIAYSAMPGVDGCGGTVTAPQGVITSPNFPTPYGDNLQCEWLVRMRPNSRIKISFEEFQIESHSDCQFDKVEIYDGPSDAYGLLGRFCGETLPPDILSNTHQIYIRFKADMTHRLPGFKLNYKTICGGVFSDLTGVLTSPNYPQPYPAHTFCVYEINLPTGYLVNLTIHDVEIEPHVDCRWDYLEVRDGDVEESPLLSRLCGFFTPMQSILSTYNKMWIKFETDGSVQNRGFNAVYEAIEIGCGGIHTEDNGTITSPRHPTAYPHNISCIWFIRAPETHMIRLTFESFRLEGSGACTFDYVIVEDTDGVRIGNKYCGDTIPPVLTSTDNTLLVKFVADESVAMEGFIANYQFLDAREACGGDFYQTSGVIRSPGYPEHYPHSLNCIWTLHAPNGRQILLDVANFSTEFHTDCKYDYLEIRNGGYKSSPLIGKFCGNQIMPKIRSHSNLLRLEFKSDRSMTGPGFEIRFDSTVVGCGGEIRASQGSIVSPNYPQPYPVNADCEWLIRVSEGSLVIISVVEIDIEEHQTCHYDYLQVYDGATENSKTLMKLCNNQQNPGAVTSSSNSVLIRFRSDFSEVAGGFNLVYQSLCNNVLKKRRGVIESPNFPNSYPHNHNCSWTIEAPLGNNISISFSHIFIEEHDNCSLDHVEVLMVSVAAPDPISLGKFCGDMTSPPPTIYASTNKVIVRLITDRSVNREGFRLEYSFIGCGGDIIDKPYGVITSPNYPYGYNSYTVCYWHIYYPPGNSVQFTIEDLDLESHSECSFDSLKVYGGENEESPLIVNACHSQTNATTISSHGNQLYVIFRSDESVSHRGFKASYKKITTGCGGHFTVEEATIMSPNFPDPYAIDDDCEWLIETASGNLVMIEFYDFEMPTADNCTRGHVALYDGSNSSSPLILKECRDKPLGLISATSNQMLVKLVADGQSVAKGFRAHYKTGCGRRLLADKGGEITSLNYPTAMRYDVNCSWIISTSQIGEKVSLTVTHLNIRSFNNCSYYSLQVFDGDMEDSPLIGKYCGMRMPPPIISRGSTLHVLLTNGGLFRATYGLLSQHCGGTFTGASGSFATPGYPMNYDMEMECVWTIEASPGSKAHVSFQSFHIESSNYCNTDYLEIHENDAAGPLIGKYCGDDIPSNVTSAAKLWLKFRSDDIGTAPGFMAHYELQHGTTITGTSGAIASPGYPTKFVHLDTYVWTVIVPERMFVSVQFTELGIPSYRDSADCRAYIAIFDGFDEQAPSLGIFCGYTLPEPVFSTGNTITIKFQGNGKSACLFYLRWSAVNDTGVTIEEDNSCFEEHILNATSTAVIQTPGFPLNYPNEYNCTYVIRTTPTHHVTLQFEAFELEGTYPVCNFDKLQSYYAPNPNVDSWNLNSTLCGRQDNLFFSSPNNLMKLDLYTDRWVNFRGFRGRAKAECGGQIFGNSGVLRSSSIYPNLQNMSRSDTLQCEWVITARDRRTIQLTFENFNIESDSTCNNNYLLIRNGGFSTSPVLGNGRYCGSSLPTIPETGSNQVYVQLVYRPTSGRSPLFDVRYTVVSLTCGGHIYLSPDIPYAEISSPNYPSPPTHDAECVWTIISPSATRMRVDFESEFHLLPNEHFNPGGIERNRPCSEDKIFAIFITRKSLSSQGSKQMVVRRCQVFKNEHFNPGGIERNRPCSEDKIFAIFITRKSLSSQGSKQMVVRRCQVFKNCISADSIEYLDIHDGGTEDAPIIKRYCGNAQPSSALSTTNALYVKYVTSSDNRQAGFKAAVKIAHCGGTVTAMYATIKSPDFPRNYGSGIECEWFLKMKLGYHILLTITEFETPPADNCSFTDYLEIRSMDSEGEILGTFCGKPSNQSIVIDVPGPEAYVKFKSNSAVTAKGFSMIMERNFEEGCGGVLQDPSGVLTSPRYPNALPHFRECYWKIAAPPGRRIKVNFEEINLPKDENLNQCNSYVAVFNVTHRYQARDRSYSHKYCGTTLPPELDSAASGLYVIFNTHGITAGQGFKLRYSTEDESFCGGVLADSGVFESPNFTVQADSVVDCFWRKDILENQTFSIKFDYLDLLGNVANFCIDSRLIFFSERRYLGSYCGNITNPFTFTSPFLTTNMRLISTVERPMNGFRGTYNVNDCGGVISASNAVITSPGYPNNYPAGMDCDWFIIAPEDEIIQISFIDLQMEEDCSKDYVLIRNGRSDQSPSLGKFCGSHAVAPFSTTSEVLTIVFHSDQFGSAKGFKIVTSEVQRGCGGLIRMNNGNISSPNYPSRYGNNVECVWTIEQSPGYLIKVEFTGRFDLEQDTTCSKDYIQLEEKGNDNSWKLLRKFCGSVNPGTIMSIGNTLRIIFHTNDRITGDGFNLAYSAHCGGNFTEPSGYILSPNYPNFYLNNLNCTYTIGKADDYITLTFDEYFSVEAHDTCVFDFVEIYQRNVSESNKQGPFCGSTAPATRTLLGPVTLRFITDYAYAAHGFKLHYEALNCGAVLTEPSGMISTPNASVSYMDEMDCTWRIIGQPDKVIQLRFLYFDVEVSSGCWYGDYLEVFDGNETGRSLGKFCGEGVKNMKSTGNELTLRFRSRRFESRGFAAYYFNTYGPKQGCGKKFVNATSGEISSLDFDNDGFYEPDLDCGWLIIVERPDQIIKLTFLSFDLQMSSNGSCDYDYVEVREFVSHGPMIGRYCGNTLPRVIMTNADQVFVHFHSDGTENKSGFKLSFEVTPSPCGTSSLIASSEERFLQSPNYPNAYPTNLRCRWSIGMNFTGRIYPFNVIEVNIPDIDIPCGSDYLEVKRTRGPFRTSVDTLRYCGNKPSQVVNYRTAVLVAFDSDPVNDGGHGFKLAYKLSNCNKTYTNEYGIINSASYPGRLNPNTHCLMRITATAGKTIALYFSQFSLMNSEDCTVSFMKIYDGNSETSPLLANYCGDFFVPNPVFSTGNEMLIKVHMDHGVGMYHINYLTTDNGRGCGGSITASEGTLTSPLYPLPYNKTGECLWSIAVPGYHTVVLDITHFALKSEAGCDTNYLEVYEGSDPEISNRIVRYCGQDIPNSRHEFRSNEVVVKLVTDTTNDQSGFFLYFFSSNHVPEKAATNFVQRFDTDS